jgi:predicted ferric reductase
MSTIWQTITWDVARAGGFTAYILLTLAVAVGLALSTQLQSPQRWPRLLNSELHNFLTLLSTIFVGIHVLAVWIDPFTRFSWSDVFIPFVSSYRTVWMAFGIVSLYLGIAIGISTWLRPRIGYTWWRRLHVLTLAVYALATIHLIGTGTDAQTWWGIAIYAFSGLLVGSLLVWRLITTKGKRKPTPVAHSNRPARPAVAASRTGAPLQSAPRPQNSPRPVAAGAQRQPEVAHVR